MTILKTANERFENLADYSFSANYVEVASSLNMHFVDEGPENGVLILMLHGEPTWSYLYRKMIPILANAGFRVIAPDLIGFGKSDKFLEKEAYSYQNHLKWLSTFIEKLDLRNITLVCQDWGGLLGLRLVAENEHKFKGVCASNTFLPIGKTNDVFLAWQEFSQTVPEFEVGKIVSMGCFKPLSDAEIAAYDAPFTDESYKAGARAFPMLVPTSLENEEAQNNLRAWEIFKKI